MGGVDFPAGAAASLHPRDVLPELPVLGVVMING
jgi:hypothetical protein